MGKLNISFTHTYSKYNANCLVYKILIFKYTTDSKEVGNRQIDR